MKGKFDWKGRGSVREIRIYSTYHEPLFTRIDMTYSICARIFTLKHHAWFMHYKGMRVYFHRPLYDVSPVKTEGDL